MGQRLRDISVGKQRISIGKHLDAVVERTSVSPVFIFRIGADIPRRSEIHELRYDIGDLFGLERDLDAV